MTKTMKLTGVALAAALMMTGAASAKGHDQGQTDEPGASVGAETVGPAKTLGATRGNGKKPAVPNGKSANAGK